MNSGGIVEIPSVVQRRDQRFSALIDQRFEGMVDHQNVCPFFWRQTRNVFESEIELLRCNGHIAHQVGNPIVAVSSFKGKISGVENGNIIRHQRGSTRGARDGINIARSPGKSPISHCRSVNIMGN